MRKFSGLNFMYGKKKKPSMVEDVKAFFNSSADRLDTCRKSWEIEAELKSKLAKNKAEIAARAAQRRPIISHYKHGKQTQAQIPRELLIFWAAMAIIAALVVLTSAPQRNKPTP